MPRASPRKLATCCTREPVLILLMSRNAHQSRFRFTFGFSLILALVGFPKPVQLQQRSESGIVRRPAWTSRWCLSPLAPYGSNELSPGDLTRPVIEGSWFRDRPAIRVDMHAPSATCKKSCFEQVSAATADAFTLWRYSCSRCSYDFLALIVTPTDVFVDERIYSALLRGPTLPIAFKEADSQMKDGTTLNESGSPEHIIRPYYRIPRSHPSLRRICELDESKDLASTWSRHLFQLQCGTSSDVASFPSLTLSFVEGDTDCGSAQEYIGCGNPAESVELTLWRTRYEIEDAPDRMSGVSKPVFVLGDPSGVRIDLHAILLHEIGHFLGISHLQSMNRPGSLAATMLATYDRTMCLSIADMMMLSSAADRLWKYASTTCEGLRRPQSK